MIGSKYKIYNDYLKTVDGYTENTEVDDPKSEPASVVHQNFFFRFLKKENEPLSGNHEDASVPFELAVVYEYFSKNTFSKNTENSWNYVGELERGLLNFAITQGEVIFIESIVIEDLSPGYKLFVITGELKYSRSLDNG